MNHIYSNNNYKVYQILFITIILIKMIHIIFLIAEHCQKTKQNLHGDKNEKLWILWGNRLRYGDGHKTRSKDK